MNRVLTILSMLHEPARGHSAIRRFRNDAVLTWTVDRLRQSRRVGDIVVLCWEDQLEAIDDAIGGGDAEVLCRGTRHAVPAMDAVTASRRWADGWRGGPFGTCAFDAGFYAPWVDEVMHDWAAAEVLLVDPAAALVDPDLIDAVVAHADVHTDVEIAFAPAAAGLAGVLLRRELVERLTKMNLHPGRLLHYMPDQPMPDPIAGPGCVEVPMRVARTTQRFLVDSQRQADRLTRATHDLNGQLIDTEAEELVRRLEALDRVPQPPREAVLELTTRRVSRPIYSPLYAGAVDRPDLTLAEACKLIDDLADVDDIRLTLGGIGDPLLHDHCLDVIAHARDRGIRAMHVETDLLDIPADRIAALANSGLDIISLHLPAMTATTYAAIMGIDRFADAVNGLSSLLQARQSAQSGVPLIVPTFTKCRGNFSEMEAWYDHWLRLLGCAVIVGPSTHGGIIPDVGVADMSASKRPRIADQMTILSDGAISQT